VNTELGLLPDPYLVKNQIKDNIKEHKSNKRQVTFKIQIGVKKELHKSRF
jgi:hypothetical protein